MIDINDPSVFTGCSKCHPKPGTSGTVHGLEQIGSKIICSNPECRHDWTDWIDKHNKAGSK